MIRIEDTAFAKWLRSQPREAAIYHLYDCLKDGPSEDNMAWELWETVHGDRSFSPAELPEALSQMLDALAVKQ